MEIYFSIAIEILPDSEQRQFEKQCIDIACEALKGRTINNPDVIRGIQRQSTQSRRG